MNPFDKITLIVKSLRLRWSGKEKQPIFIIGTGRCGSSLLVDILATNKEIRINQDELYYELLPALKEGFEVDPIYSDLVRPDITAKKSLKKYSLLYKLRLFTILSRLSNGDGTYILKSPAMTFVLDEVFQLFPKTKFIHLHRNGFAVARSWYLKEYFREKRYQKYFTDDEFLNICAKYYEDSIVTISEFIKKVPSNNQLTLSYETFTQNPEEHIEAILKFINVDSPCNFDYSTVRSTNDKINKLPEQKIDELKAIMNTSLRILNYN